MQKVIVKMGEGIESNCNLSGTPVQAGKVVEVSGSDASYVLNSKLGRRANASEIAEFLTINGRKSEIPKPKTEKEPKEPKVDGPEKPAEPKVEEPKVEDSNPEPKGEKTLEDLKFGELKDKAEKLGVKITKTKGRVTKNDFIEAIKKHQKGK